MDDDIIDLINGAIVIIWRGKRMVDFHKMIDLRFDYLYDSCLN